MNSTFTPHTPTSLFHSNFLTISSTSTFLSNNMAMANARTYTSTLLSKSISDTTILSTFLFKSVSPGYIPFNARASTFLCKSISDTTILSNTRDRLQLLVAEFLSLEEPIERVKRLLDYAARLPPFPNSARSPANKVTGCTTQVWLQVSMDNEGKMRFRGDSDSEITKGFIWCLIYVLDGAEPDEIVAVKGEELAAINVGLYGKEQSRVNTWHNILTAMQNRSKDFMTTPNFVEANVYS